MFKTIINSLILFFSFHIVSISIVLAGDYIDNGNSTITDRTTGLMWQKKDDGVRRDWFLSLKYCEALKLGGYSDWRVPNIRELSRLVDDTQSEIAIDPLFSCQPNFYWSSTTQSNSPNAAWGVYFYGGDMDWSQKNFSDLVRCVRAGPTGSIDPLTIQLSLNPTKGEAPLQVDLSVVVSGGQSPYTYSWDFGDGLIQQDQAAETTHVFTPGIYTIIVYVKDSAGEFAQTNSLIEVFERSPMQLELAANPLQGEAPLLVNFNVSITGGYFPYQYEWDLGDGIILSHYGPSASRTYLSGTYRITVYATDALENQASTTQEIQVYDPQPLLIKIQPSTIKGDAPLNVDFQAIVSGGYPPYAFAWDMGNGIIQTDLTDLVSNTYSPGNYIITVYVTDFKGQRSQAFQAIEALKPQVPPLKASGYEFFSTPGEAVTLTASDGSGNYRWLCDSSTGAYFYSQQENSQNFWGNPAIFYSPLTPGIFIVNLTDGLTNIQIKVNTTRPTKLTISPDKVLLTSIGSSARFLVIADYNDGTSGVLNQVTWQSTNENIASVQENVIVAKSDGIAEIIATYQHIETRVMVTVDTKPMALTIDPGLLLLNIGETAIISVIGTYRDGSTKPITDISLETSSSDIIAISGQSITGNTEGNTILTAKYNSITDTCQVQVSMPRPVNINPPSLRIKPGETVQVYIDGGTLPFYPEIGKMVGAVQRTWQIDNMNTPG
ncbi:MAG: DUF1566 domain-containing protein, partial [Desulfobacterales bacterium]|nr:DUF1566 domain-containing protein [Desulfobacterales bacterium]